MSIRVHSWLISLGPAKRRRERSSWPTKNPPTRGGFESTNWKRESDERFGDRGVEFHGARVIPFDAMHLVASLQHAVEFVDEERDGFVAFVRLHGRIHIGALDFDVPLGLELHAGGGIAVAFQLHADAHDALLVAKQSFGFLADERLQRRREFEMNA